MVTEKKREKKRENKRKGKRRKEKKYCPMGQAVLVWRLELHAVLLPSLTGCVIKSKIINNTSYRKRMEIRQFAFHLVRMYWDLM